MTNAMYRGYKVVANDNAAPKTEAHDAVYRGQHYDPSAPKAANQNAKPKVTYRGATAA